MTSPEEKHAGQGASTAKPTFGSAWPGFDPASLTLNPMMANPAAAMAAMTQIGIELQTQFATAMFGMMQNAMDASQRLHRTLEDMAREPAASEAEKAEAPAPTATKTRTAKAAQPEAKDDLKRISGLGPKIETKLNGLGITTLSEIAGWSADEAARVDAELGLDGRVTRDDWVAQANALTTGTAQELPPVRAAARKTGGRKNRT
ncbi:NADH-quinone oxidoreductase subunit E [Neorhizobium huautlense]|uniref:NADH-quinone oxidoreductase subunit E n=1 Tax=Neorhizobium huautlense TaxID=67774 RepID=A0ABT9Q242_9HYPH|nr:5' DNA nuclease [Neorhizobium huautlense]MDP9840184.1 NADH-quinone oxidoreductase subunit E [Neorhizobium huautlense]